jgi:hypothetical protein
MNKNEMIVLAIALLVSFALGRYSSTLTTTTTQHTATKTNDDIKTQTHALIVTLKRADGDVQTTETIDSTADNKLIQDQQTTAKTVVQTQKQSQLNVSLLVAEDLSQPVLVPRYGLSITKQLVGPVTFGLFGLNNGTLGVSIGLNF